jgi:predicted MFS family arabinose efflux permease
LVQSALAGEPAEGAGALKAHLTRALALGALFLGGISSYADRSVMAVTQEPMKHDLGLTDTQLGLLSGPVFAILYALVGLPVARLAERRNRKAIVVAALSVWSIATAACGFIGGFFSMALARVCVGGGEAAAPPAMHSMIADFYPARQRGRAMAFYNLSIPLGLTVGTSVGGLVASAAGWRAAFIALGAAGLGLAVVTWLVLSEPARGSQEGEAAPAVVAPVGHAQAFGMLLMSRTFLLLLLANGLAGIATHGVSSFSASFFVRSHHMSLPQVTGLLALAHGAVGIFGVLASGFLADRLARHGTRSYVIVPGVGALGCSLLFFIAYHQPSADLASAAFVAAYFFANMIPTPAFAAVQNMAPPQIRATAAASLLFMITVIGGLGPWIVGGASDGAAARSFPTALGTFAASCPGGHAAAGAASVLTKACATASSSGLQTALAIPVAVFAAVAACFFLAALSTGRTLKL